MVAEGPSRAAEGQQTLEIETTAIVQNQVSETITCDNCHKPSSWVGAHSRSKTPYPTMCVSRLGPTGSSTRLPPTRSRRRSRCQAPRHPRWAIYPRQSRSCGRSSRSFVPRQTRSRLRPPIVQAYPGHAAGRSTGAADCSVSRRAWALDSLSFRARRWEVARHCRWRLEGAVLPRLGAERQALRTLLTTPRTASAVRQPSTRSAADRQRPIGATRASQETKRARPPSSHGRPRPATRKAPLSRSR